jgi:hypothetical protein
MQLRDILDKYMSYNHEEYLIRRMRLKGEEKNSDDYIEEMFIINELMLIFSFSKDEAWRIYSDWFTHKFE